MDKNTQDAIQRDVYEIKGELSIIRKDLGHYAKQLGVGIALIFLALLVIASKL